MTERNWEGHHCKVCYEEANRQKARQQAKLIQERSRQIIEPPPQPEPPPPKKKVTAPVRRGYVFAKSCALPDGAINHRNPNGFVPVELLSQYGAYAVLGTGKAVSVTGATLGSGER
jgi:hypothetical protein